MATFRLALSFVILCFSCTGCLAGSSVWAVRSEGEVVYLGGTLHVLRGSDYPLPVEFDTAYAASGELFFETDIGRLAEPETREAMLERLRYDDGRTLSRVLSAEVYSLLSAQSQAMGVSLRRFERYRPVMVLLGLLALELEGLGFSADGVDAHFYARALADGKSIGSLETVESQIEVLASLGEGHESSFVALGIEDLRKTADLLGAAVAAWRVGDERRLAETLLDSTRRDYPRLYGSLVVQRNREWLPRIGQLFARPGTEFVLVGVGHLVGEDGLLRQLEYRGYRVRRLEPGAVK